MSELQVVENLERAIEYLKSENVSYPERHLDFINDTEELIDNYYKNISVNGVFLLEKPQATGMDIGRAISNMLERGDCDDYPKNPICSHFGVSQRVGETYIEMSSRWVGGHEDNVQFTIYIGSDSVQEVSRGVRKWKRYPKRIHELRKRCIRKVTGLKVVECWNDFEGSEGISIVLDRLCPKSVLAAVQGYRTAPDIFNFTEKEKGRWNRFEKWWSGGTIFNT